MEKDSSQVTVSTYIVIQQNYVEHKTILRYTVQQLKVSTMRLTDSST